VKAESVVLWMVSGGFDSASLRRLGRKVPCFLVGKCQFKCRM